MRKQKLRDRGQGLGILVSKFSEDTIASYSLQNLMRQVYNFLLFVINHGVLTSKGSYLFSSWTNSNNFVIQKLTMYKPVIQKLIMYKAAAAITAAATAAVEGSKQEQKMLFNKSL
ncbi:hypothetical protein S83_051194 [Arachis hypogaea]|nr:putative trehalose-phosphate phosphatase I [Arachis hypogaea]